MSSQTTKQQPPADSEYADELLDHEYDGIREYDNPMPGWWKWIFVGTVIWAAIYFVGINMGFLPTYQDDLAQGEAELEKMRNAAAVNAPKVDAALLAKVAKDTKAVAAGHEIFEAKCSPCHGKQAQGIVGPNLTDKYWLHGGKLTDIYHTVKTGVTDKGMPTWGGVLKDKELLDVVAFVHSVRGSNPPNPKAPQGKPFAGK